VPKCIVHGAGGTLLQHLKEHQLHCDISAGDRVFYFTTCGWMMWNWLVSALASERRCAVRRLAVPSRRQRAVRLRATARMTLFGTSAKFIDAAQKAALEPARTHRLDTVRTIASTGSPLAPESFDFVYEHVKRDVHLASISGGTDIAGCFALGNPAGPVWRGEIQVRGLGMAWRSSTTAVSRFVVRKASWCARIRFPRCRWASGTIPTGASTTRRISTSIRVCGAMGTTAELTEHDGLIIYGRSDATLNPGGVRIGTAEIYRQVEQIDAVVESLSSASVSDTTNGSCCS
jgi:acetoacetyl-CoA synthetase